MFYPIFVDLAGRRCLVVGGGSVAERKVTGLLKHRAAVRVVSPRVTPGLARLAAEGRIEVVLREYRRGDADGAFLAFAATGDAAVNRLVRQDAAALGVPVNAADDPANCTFIVPATLERGDLTIAISTAGKSPALAKRLRERLEREIGPEYAMWLDMLGEARAWLQARQGERQARADILFSLVDDPVYLRLLRSGREAEARERMRAALLAATGESSPRG